MIFLDFLMRNYKIISLYFLMIGEKSLILNVVSFKTLMILLHDICIDIHEIDIYQYSLQNQNWREGNWNLPALS